MTVAKKDKPFVALTMKFVPGPMGDYDGSWTLFDAEEKDVGTLAGWVAEDLCGDNMCDYTGETEYLVVIEGEGAQD